MNYETIREYVEAGLTPAQIAAELQAQTVAVENKSLWTFGAIESTIDETTARLIAGVVQAAGQSDPLMSSAFVALSTTGLQLHTAARQALIEQIGQAAGMTSEQITVVKELGLKITTPFADVTEQDVIDCIEAWQAPADETRHEVLLSANRSTGGIVRVVARVTAVEYAAGQQLRRGQPQTVQSDDLTAAVSAILEGLIDG